MNRVLIVEDDADNGRSLAEAIRDLGHAAELAPDGASGVEAFRGRGAERNQKRKEHQSGRRTG